MCWEKSGSIQGKGACPHIHSIPCGQHLCSAHGHLLILLRGFRDTEPALACHLFGQLRAFALDLGGSTLEEPTDLEIVVVDQNDNRPAFLQDVFRGRILEGAIPGEVGAQTPPMGWGFRKSKSRIPHNQGFKDRDTATPCPLLPGVCLSSMHTSFTLTLHNGQSKGQV